MKDILKWLVPAIIGLVGSSIYAVVICCNENNYILTDNFREFIYILYIYLFVGIFSGIFLVLIYLLNYKNGDFMSVTKIFNKKIAVALAILLIFYQSAILISINIGGPVSMGIFNFNLALITILLYFIYKKPINNIMIYGIVLMMISSSIIIYGKTKLTE
jgi:hypothetical protein